METPDPYTVLDQWLTAGLGKAGRALQGTTPARYEADLRDWLHFVETVTGIGAWNATEATAETWAKSPTLRAPSHGQPSRRPIAPRRSLHNPARRLAALAAFYAYATTTGHIAEPPFHAAALRPAPAELPRITPLTAEQAGALAYAAHDLVPGLQHRGPYDTAPYRDRVLVLMCLDGLRPRQAVGIDLEDLHEPDPHRGVRTLTCPVVKGDGTATFQPSAELWDAITDYLPHRVDGRDPATGRRPLLTSRNGRRLDSNTTPGRIVKAVAARVPELIFEPAAVTPDRVAHGPAVLRDLPPTGHRAAAVSPLQQLRTDLQHLLDSAPLCATTEGGCPPGCQRCAERKAMWSSWENTWKDGYPPAYLGWDVPAYDYRQRPADRLQEFHQGRCAICGTTPAPGRPAHTEDHDPRTGFVRGLLCYRCRPQADDEAAPPYWSRYRQHPPAAFLGLDLHTSGLRPSR
ncbi:endonuclease domain-containing protein [Kitasatospora xanthocidica]|uniref:endonuclease domain-containing protein n=1 Tax=Kitasatospora xanthocidica TaxID=83382 RepID=UPI0036EA92AF